MKVPFNQCMNRNFGVRLKTQLLLVFAAIFTLLMVCVVALTYQQTERIVEEQTAELTGQYLEQSRYNVKTYAEQINKLLFSLSRTEGISDYFRTGWQNSEETILTAASIFKEVRDTLIQYEEVDSVFFYSDDGVVLGISPLKNLIHCDPLAAGVYFGGPIQEQIEIAFWHPFWTGGYTSADFGLDEPDEAIPYITVARTININADRIGVVMINIRETEFYRDIWQSQQDTIGTGLVIDNAGTVIAAPQNDFLGVPYGGGILPQECGNAIVGDRQINCLRIEDEPGMDWALVYEISLDSLYQNTYTLRDFFIVTSVVALLLGLLIAMYLFYRISKPLDQLQIAMKKMQEYDIGIKLEQRSRTELGQLGAQFDEMSNSIERMVGQIQTMEQEKCYLEERVLQSQINPHFLMNTLSNIKYMAMILKSNTIVDCITALGNILSPIYRSNEQEWSVEEEMRYIDNYVKVMNYRFGGKIQIHYQVCQEDKQARVLRFILQPLIENSILHGFENTSEEKKILVSIHERDGGWIVAVKDNGSGMDEERLRRLRESVTQPEELTQENRKNHIGLKNVYQRLRLFYGAECSLRIESEPGLGTEITMTFPTKIRSAPEIVASEGRG